VAASEEEEDMLDLAFGLTRTSRLGCQLTLTENMDGIIFSLPNETNNLIS
jgi:2Fe-2S ferredoxin